jgi:hypothetical protein
MRSWCLWSAQAVRLMARSAPRQGRQQLRCACGNDLIKLWIRVLREVYSCVIRERRREAEDFTQKAGGTAGRKSSPLPCRRSTTRCNSRNPNCGFWKCSGRRLTDGGNSEKAARRGDLRRGVAERDRVPSSRLNTAPTCIPCAIEAVALYNLEKISRESPKRLKLGSKPVISSYARDNRIFEWIMTIATAR